MISSGYQGETYFFQNDLKQWKEGPQMIKSRGYHGCGSFDLEDQQVLIVVGDYRSSNRRSVEFLMPNEAEPKWIAGRIPINWIPNF